MEGFKASTEVEEGLAFIDWILENSPNSYQSRAVSETQLRWLSQALKLANRKLSLRIEKTKKFVQSDCINGSSENNFGSIVEGVEIMRKRFESEPEDLINTSLNVDSSNSKTFFSNEPLCIDRNLIHINETNQEPIFILEKAIDLVLKTYPKVIKSELTLRNKVKQLSERLEMNQNLATPFAPSFDTLCEVANNSNNQSSGKNSSPLKTAVFGSFNSFLAQPKSNPQGFFAEVSQVYLNQELGKENKIAQNESIKKISKNFTSIGLAEVRSNHQFVVDLSNAFGKMQEAPFKLALNLLFSINFLLNKISIQNVQKAHSEVLARIKEAEKVFWYQEKLKSPPCSAFSDVGFSFELFDKQEKLVSRWVQKCENLKTLIISSF